MSRLSRLMHRYQNTGLLRAVVEYLETIDLPGTTKKAIAVAVVKALHVQTGGKWDKELQRIVEGAIEYVLAEVRDSAKDWNTHEPVVPEPAEPVGDTPVDPVTS